MSKWMTSLSFVTNIIAKVYLGEQECCASLAYVTPKVRKSISIHGSPSCPIATRHFLNLPIFMDYFIKLNVWAIKCYYEWYKVYNFTSQFSQLAKYFISKIWLYTDIIVGDRMAFVLDFYALTYFCIWVMLKKPENQVSCPFKICFIAYLMLRNSLEYNGSLRRRHSLPCSGSLISLEYQKNDTEGLIL